MRGSGLLTTSSTCIPTFAATTFHIVIIDASGSFLHTSFQFTNPVADADSKATTRPLAAALRQEVYAFRMIVIASVFLKYITAIHIQAQTLIFQERTARTQTIIIIAGTFPCRLI